MFWRDKTLYLARKASKNKIFSLNAPFLGRLQIFKNGDAKSRFKIFPY